MIPVAGTATGVIANKGAAGQANSGMAQKGPQVVSMGKTPSAPGAMDNTPVAKTAPEQPLVVVTVSQKEVSGVSQTGEAAALLVSGHADPAAVLGGVERLSLALQTGMALAHDELLDQTFDGDMDSRSGDGAGVHVSGTADVRVVGLEYESGDVDGATAPSMPLRFRRGSAPRRTRWTATAAGVLVALSVLTAASPLQAAEVVGLVNPVLVGIAQPVVALPIIGAVAVISFLVFGKQWAPALRPRASWAAPALDWFETKGHAIGLASAVGLGLLMAMFTPVVDFKVVPILVAATMAGIVVLAHLGAIIKWVDHPRTWKSRGWEFAKRRALMLSLVSAIFLAFGGAMIFGPKMAVFGVLGTYFLKGLKFLVIPILVLSVTSAIARLGQGTRLRRLVTTTIIYNLATTFVAVSISMAVFISLQPGVGVVLPEISELTGAMGGGGQGFSFLDFILGVVAPNPIDAIVNINMPAILFYSIVVGSVIAFFKMERTSAALDKVDSFVMKRIVSPLTSIMPLGIFGILAGTLAEVGDVWGFLETSASLMGSELLIAGIHGFVTLPLVFWIVTRKNPYRYMMEMMTPLLTAFGTASSAITMPVTQEAVEEKGEISEETARFVIPLGTTVNMDGLAMFLTTAAVFMAQAYGIELTLSQYAIILFTGAIMSIGAAGVPNIMTVTFVLILNSVGLPLEGIAIIAGTEWLLDRFLTSLNVWGDISGAKVIDTLVKPGEAGSGSAG